jgi:uncharacterized lipoprotein YddW (UPF0748 family)
MRKQIMWFCLATILLTGNALQSQDRFIPKREFRGVWIATVKNIDFPAQPTSNAIALQEQWRLMLKKFKEVGVNAVIMQIRPSADAFYPSELVPWSRYLTGKEGQPPIPAFDLLEFMIRETHNQSMEFHAWLNPYRATTDLDTLSLAPNHVLLEHPDWVVKYGRRYYLNPALPQVRDHLTAVVAEIVSKYDVDAIHFDDYFYPYKVKGETFPDSLAFQTLGPQFDNIGDWRRHNVDQLIEQVSQQIKTLKPHVQFGISPFGVWRNEEDDPSGSKTKAGVTCYDDLYADITKWMRRDWIDYVAPQLYWHTGFEPADYATLLDWWSARSSTTQLYVGHAIYKVANNDELAWHSPTEIPLQISRSRLNFNSKGSILYNANSVTSNRLGVRDSIRQLFAYPALIPEPVDDDVTMRQHSAPKLKKVRRRKGGMRLKWCPNKADKEDPPSYYVIYRFKGTQPGNYEDPRNILAITPFNVTQKRYKYYDYATKADQTYTYVIKPVNRLHQEGKGSNVRPIKRKKRGVKNIRR